MASCISVSFQSFVFCDIISPASDCTGKSSGDPFLFADLPNGEHIRPDREQNAAASWEPPQSLSFRSKMDIVNGGIGLSIVPSYPERVFRANVLRPRQRIVGLDEIVVSFNWTVWFDTLEEA
jgi:hypothetical protein